MTDHRKDALQASESSRYRSDFPSQKAPVALEAADCTKHCINTGKIEVPIVLTTPVWRTCPICPIQICLFTHGVTARVGQKQIITQHICRTRVKNRQFTRSRDADFGI